MTRQYEVVYIFDSALEEFRRLAVQAPRNAQG